MGETPTQTKREPRGWPSVAPSQTKSDTKPNQTKQNKPNQTKPNQTKQNKTKPNQERHLHKPRGSQKAGQGWLRAQTVSGDPGFEKEEDACEKRPKQYTYIHRHI